MQLSSLWAWPEIPSQYTLRVGLHLKTVNNYFTLSSCHKVDLNVAKIQDIDPVLVL